MRKTGQFKEQEPLGAGEIFLKQAISLEASWASWKNRFLLTKTNSVNGSGRKSLAKKTHPFRRLYNDLGGLRKNLLVNADGNFIGATDKDGQPINFHLVKLLACGCLEPDGQSRSCLQRSGQFKFRYVASIISGIDQLQRPKANFVCSSKLAGCLIVICAQSRVSLQK